MRRTVAALEREAFLAGFYKAFGFACGPCGLCEECAVREGLPARRTGAPGDGGLRH